ncbi:MAG TPA: glutathionylspermidine synthase family protein [Rudaea sp.]
MRREKSVPRADWPARLEELGFDFHTIDGEPYWREDVCYAFTSDEVDTIEAATAELHALCLDAVDRIVLGGMYGELGLDEAAAQLVERSWRAREPALYGRMDLAWDGTGAPKLLEYNADTPTALFEASVVQWYWLQDVRREADQFNSIHEKLIERWRALALRGKIHFAACYEQAEDRATSEYLRDTAHQADLETTALDIEEIGWSGRTFFDLDNQPIATLFKLYPWEWLLDETFGANIPAAPTRWIEPAWKMLLSNKSILPLLWEFNPHHPNLLAASHRRLDLQGRFVSKPRHGREGEGVIVLGPGLSEPPADAAQVYQQFQQLPKFDDRYALIGSWMIGDEPAGIGMREDADPVTRNTSCFVPHWFA